MSNYEQLKADIAAVVRANGIEAITGDRLQQVLTHMVDVLGNEYALAGVATPTTNPPTPDGNTAYIAGTSGTYTYFLDSNYNPLVVPSNCLTALLMYDASAEAWTAYPFGTIAQGSIGTNELADGAVTTPKIADSAVTSAKIGANAVTSAKINNGAVSEQKLATAVQNKINDAVTLSTSQTITGDKEFTQPIQALELYGDGDLSVHALDDLTLQSHNGDVEIAADDDINLNGARVFVNTELNVDAGLEVGTDTGGINSIKATGKILTNGQEVATKAYTDMQLATKQETIADLATIRSGAALGATAYQKPSGGIPGSDLSASVQTSLGKADTALQASDITGKADKVAGATNGNLAALNSSGNLTDSGKKAADFADATAFNDLQSYVNRYGIYHQLIKSNARPSGMDNYTTTLIDNIIPTTYRIEVLPFVGVASSGYFAVLIQGVKQDDTLYTFLNIQGQNYNNDGGAVDVDNTAGTYKRFRVFTRPNYGEFTFCRFVDTQILSEIATDAANDTIDGLISNSVADLAFTDGNGYDIVRFQNGHVKTKNFDSETVADELYNMERGTFNSSYANLFSFQLNQNLTNDERAMLAGISGATLTADALTLPAGVSNRICLNKVIAFDDECFRLKVTVTTSDKILFYTTYNADGSINTAENCSYILFDFTVGRVTIYKAASISASTGLGTALCSMGFMTGAGNYILSIGRKERSVFARIYNVSTANSDYLLAKEEDYPNINVGKRPAGWMYYYPSFMTLAGTPQYKAFGGSTRNNLYMIFQGDSYTQGYNIFASQTWANMAAKYFGNSMVAAISGGDLDDSIAQYHDSIKGKVDVKVMVLSIGINDILVNGVTAATAGTWATRYKNYIDELVADGITPIVNCIWPEGSSNTNYQSAGAAMNGYIRGWGFYGAEFGNVTGFNTNSTYYSNTHLNVNGNNATFKRFINELFLFKQL